MYEQGYQLRAADYHAAAAAAAATWYDRDGNWIATSQPAAGRERLWIAFSLMRRNPELGNAVIAHLDTPRYAQGRYNIFDTNVAASLLVQFGDRLTDANRANLESLVRDGFNFRPGNRQPDYQFHGYNDNMPAKATMGLILGGELLGNHEAVEYGIWSLRQMRAMLQRNGVNSENNSPTYSALTIHAMSEIAEFAASDEARELALGIEQRLWFDVAARFHPGIGMISGPSARSYTIDKLGHLSLVGSLLWFVIGDTAKPSPMELFDADHGMVLHHMGDLPFVICSQSWYASAHYHIPKRAWELLHRKAYPSRAMATLEVGNFGPDFPARPVHTETYLAADYTVGTQTSAFGGGEQTMCYQCTYKRVPDVTSFRDHATVFYKLVIDNPVPGAIEKPSPDVSNSGESDLLVCKGGMQGYQHDSTAVLLSHPHLALGDAVPHHNVGTPGPAAAKPISDISEMVLFPGHHGEIAEVIVGGQPRATWDGEVPHGAWVAVRTGRLLIGIRPLAYSRLFGHATLSLERANAYQYIRARHYGGAPRSFTRDELREVFGGFIAEHASVDDFPSLAAFAAWLAAGKVHDYYWTTRRVRYYRPATAARPELDFEFSSSPGAQIPRYVTFNGRRPSFDTPCAYTGVETAELPFLNEPHRPQPPFFPWEDFKVEWGDWPYAIGDREL